MSRIDLRDYQREAVDAVFSGFEDGLRRPAVVLPTGGGKTIVFAHIADELLRKGRRPVVLVHRDELVRQAAAKMALVGVRTGIVRGEENNVEAPAIVASVQTLARENRRLMLDPTGVDVIVDECHHATAKSYTTVLGHFGAFEGTGRAIGFTATMDRADGGRLGDVWERIVYQRDISWMIRKGWLADVKGVRLKVEDLNLANVRMTAGDYNEGDMGEALAASSSPEKVAEAILEHAPDRPGILFAPTVETAHLFADALNDAGIKAETVHGAMPIDERRRILADYERGRIQYLCNCMVLTEGFDSPRAEVCVIARPTTSTPLYVQMVGRVLRLFKGKLHALVVDVVGASESHPLATIASLSGRPVKVKEGESLLEAIDAFEEEVSSRAPIVYADGTVVSEEVDLFHGSRIQWVQSRAGFWFIPAGDARYIALCPAREPGAYDVAWFATRVNGAATRVKGAGDNGGWLARDVPDLALAMAYAESDITDDEEVIAAKGRAWKKRKASEKSLAFAKRLGVDLETLPDHKGGTVGAAITRVLASQRIDGPLTNYLRAQGIAS